MLDLAQYQIVGTTAREIAVSAEASIAAGGLETGAQLPTVRALAQRLGTSPATVNAAYRTLRQRGLVVADGRRGTRVAPRPAVRRTGPPRPPESDPPSFDARDLAVGLPDPELLPPLMPALARIDLERKLQMSRLEEGDDALLELARTSFADDGAPQGDAAIVGGAFDGIERVLQAHLRPGDRVVIEDPAYTTTRDLLLALGLIAVPVAVDDRGLIPELLEAALTKGVDAAVIVPRAQNPIGAAFDEERSAELRGLLRERPDLLVIEDDHTSVVAGTEFSTVIGPERRRWAMIRSTSKILHPDLRLALMAGDETTIARVEGRLAVGTRWVSHVLQALVAELMLDPTYPETISRARAAYARRRQAMLDALADRGIAASGRTGLNVWVPVREEGPVVRALLEQGWFVLAGERFRIETPPGIRITVATLAPGEADAVARVIAEVEHAGRPRRAY
jgi:DNA-binding transcriptional MocR family regulator